MSVALDYYLDQQRCDQQDEILEQLYTQGFTDGYEGYEKNSFEEPYRQGYEKGLSTWIKEEQTRNLVVDDYLPF